MSVRAAVGIGSNLGDPAANVRAAFEALARTGNVVARSRLYRSKPWGKHDQPDFCNAVALIETQLAPHELLHDLKGLERELGRVPGEHWGPRAIDLDILVYGDLHVDDTDLRIPHPHLYERAFALVPLAEVDPRFAPAVAALPPGETVALMSDDNRQASEQGDALVERVRMLVQAFLETDLVRLRVEDEREDVIELRRRLQPAKACRQDVAPDATVPAARANLEPIKADLVGIFHLKRPAVHEGERLEKDRELAYVEALGIRNPVRSLGSGRVASIYCADGDPVEYGQILFEMDRG